MHLETAGSLFYMRRSRKFSRGWGSPSDQGGSSSIPVESSKSIKMGRSWHRFLLLVHSEARTRFDDIDKP